ncbi:MAG: hypothetical protein EHM12_07835 [Dehalococcoidia bacterium]|nr:MAG: hypothetical protein EHM12_07835 [Dehalococcoidia bacterium]
MNKFSRLLSVLLIAVLLATAFPMISMPAPAQAAADWTTMNSGTFRALRGIWGSASNDVWAVGGEGTILHYNGSTWASVTSPDSTTLTGVWGSSSTNVFAVGWNGTIIHWDGNTWSTMTSGTSRDLYGVWGDSANSVFAVGGSQTVLHWNGTTWSSVFTSLEETSFNAVWGTAYNNVYIIGAGGNVYRWNGSTWSAVDIGASFSGLSAIWGSSATDIYIADDSGTVWHYNGTSWNWLILSSAPLNGLWGTSASDVFLVGNNNVVQHSDGSNWTGMSTDAAYDAYICGVWGQCSTDVFAVGDGGLILHYGSGCTAGPSRASVGTKLGEVTFTTDAGLIGSLLNVKIASTKCATPAGYDFPYGLFSFNITGLTNGQTVRTTIKFPRRLPNNMKYYKCIDNKMVDCTSLITRLDDYTLVLRITDGGLGDSDHSANGAIVDPGGPVEPVSAAQVYGQGTISTTVQQAPVSLPSVSVKSASLSSTRVGPGEAVTVTANVANTGTANGTSSIKVYVNGEVDTTQGVTVSSGSSTPVTFTVSRNEPGTYDVYVGGISAGSFTVDQFTPQTILIISAALVFFAFVIGAIYMVRRKQAL